MVLHWLIDFLAYLLNPFSYQPHDIWKVLVLLLIGESILEILDILVDMIAPFWDIIDFIFFLFHPLDLFVYFFISRFHFLLGK